MNYNPRTGFSEQDYHLLKTHQSSGGGSAIKQELLTGITSISFDSQHNYMFDIVCDTYIGGSYAFTGSSGCSITRINIDNPENVEDTSRMVITIATNSESGTIGQIFWGNVYYKITCTSGSSWTINLPDGRFYNGVKTEVGDPGEVL